MTSQWYQYNRLFILHFNPVVLFRLKSWLDVVELIIVSLVLISSFLLKRKFERLLILLKETTAMTEKKTYILEDWGTDSQIELVKDSSRTWEKKRFKVVPGFWTLKDGTKVLGKVTRILQPVKLLLILSLNVHGHLSTGLQKF